MELLAFEVSRNACALPLARVLELLPVPHVTPVPHAPAALRGVVNVRGRVVPVVDLAVRLGGTAATLTRSSLLLVADARVEGASAPCALLVDAATDILRVEEAAIAARPATGPMASATAVRGFVTSARGALLVLDLDALLEPEALRGCAAPEGVLAAASSPVASGAREPTARGSPAPHAWDGERCAAPPSGPAAPPPAPPSQREPAGRVAQAPAMSAPQRRAQRAASPRSLPPARPSPRVTPQEGILAAGADPLVGAPPMRPARSRSLPDRASVPLAPRDTAERSSAPAAEQERRASEVPRRAARAVVTVALGLAALAAAGLLARAPGTPTSNSTPTPTSTETVRGKTVRPERSGASAPRSRRASTSGPPRPAPPDPRTVVVRRGDTLWDLAARHRRDPHSWPVLHHANGAQIGNPDLIRPGQRLVIPD